MNTATVKLGLMPPLTGVVDIYGQEIAWAGRIACEEVNESGGVLGRSLELVIEDDGSLPGSAVAAATKLVDQNCVAIIGNLLSNSRIAVAYQVAEPRKIPYLNFSFYEGSILSRYFFHFAALPNQQIDKMIPYMGSKFGSRMFFAGNNYEWPRGSIDAAKRALAKLDGQVAGEEYSPIGITLADIDLLLDQVEQSGAEVFVPYFAGSDQVHLLTRFTERGLKQRMAVVMGHYDEVMASRLPPAVREGFYSSNTYFMTLDTPENQQYLQRLASRPEVKGIWPQGNGLLTNFGEGTYLCVKAFAKAANQAGSLDPEALVRALETVRVSGPQGSVAMDPVIHHAQVNTYLSRCQADGTFAIVERFGAIPPVLPERYRHLRISQQPGLEEDIRLQARMLEQMTEAILLVSAEDGSILYCSSGVERMFGYTSSELSGQNFAMLLDPSGQDPQAVTATIRERVLRKGLWEGEVRNKTKEGSRLWCAVSVSVFTHPRHGEVWMISNRDITKRKKTEEELNELNTDFVTLLENTSDYIYFKDKDSRFRFCSQTLARITGHASWRDMIGKHDLEVFPPDTARIYFEEELPIFRDGDPLLNKTDPFYDEQGKLGWVSTNKWPVFADDRKTVVGIFGISRDVTELKQAEERIFELNRDLERRVVERTAELKAANEELEAFAYSVSHDLRAPLRAIDGFSQMLLEDYSDKLDEEGQRLLNVLRSRAIRMAQLIDDILRFSRAGRTEITSSSINMEALFSEVLDELQPAFAGRQLQIELGALPKARGDRAMMRQVIENLLGNSLKFTGKKADARITIGGHSEDGKALYFIRDNGAGFDMRYADRLFGVFQRLHGTDDFEGTGIGLAIVKRIVSRLGGTVWAEGEVGKGATFYFTLPSEAT